MPSHASAGALLQTGVTSDPVALGQDAEDRHPLLGGAHSCAAAELQRGALLDRSALTIWSLYSVGISAEAPVRSIEVL